MTQEEYDNLKIGDQIEHASGSVYTIKKILLDFCGYIVVNNNAMIDRISCLHENWKPKFKIIDLI